MSAPASFASARWRRISARLPSRSPTTGLIWASASLMSPSLCRAQRRREAVPGTRLLVRRARHQALGAWLPRSGCLAPLLAAKPDRVEIVGLDLGDARPQLVRRVVLRVKVPA